MGLSFIKPYAMNFILAKYIKQNLTELQQEINCTFMEADFQTFLSDSSCRPKEQPKYRKYEHLKLMETVEHCTQYLENFMSS